MNSEQRKYYNKGYYAGYRKATIDHLGAKCYWCDENQITALEIHHHIPLLRRGRSLRDLEDLKELRLLCKRHHDKKIYIIVKPQY